MAPVPMLLRQLRQLECITDVVFHQHPMHLSNLFLAGEFQCDVCYRQFSREPTYQCLQHEYPFTACLRCMGQYAAPSRSFVMKKQLKEVVLQALLEFLANLLLLRPVVAGSRQAPSAAAAAAADARLTWWRI